MRFFCVIVEIGIYIKAWAEMKFIQKNVDLTWTNAISQASFLSNQSQKFGFSQNYHWLEQMPATDMQNLKILWSEIIIRLSDLFLFNFQIFEFISANLFPIAKIYSAIEIALLNFRFVKSSPRHAYLYIGCLFLFFVLVS